jgi:hypothetical protein
MGYVFLGLLALLLALLGYQGFRRLAPLHQSWLLRWGVGGAAALLTILLAISRRIDLAVFTGSAAVSILRFGRLGPFTFGAGVGKPQPGKVSTVHSRYFEMALDHDSGAVGGRVIAGAFSGRDLGDLREAETRDLLAEISADADSLRLLETWLDANRVGWREHFADQGGTASASAPAMTSEAEAWAVLGLDPGADAEQIRRAHRELMKGIHPDHGGSSYLAAKINQARDVLLKGG